MHDGAEVFAVNDFERRLVRIEQWRAARWREDDLYKKLPLIGERNLVEPSVVSMLKYFLKPGDVAFDVGSQAGHVVHAMSQLVGPKGLVVAFEASVRTARKLLININDANLRNVELVHAAVCARSGDRLKLYLHSSQNNDSLFPAGFSPGGSFSQDRYALVDTISIDDYCEKWGIYPRLLKFDIEGAELEALRGATKLFSQHRPVVLIEDSDTNLECFDFLSSQGYRCFDLITLKPLMRAARSVSSEANYLFVHERESLDAIFNRSLQEFCGLSSLDFSSTNQAGLSVSPPIMVPTRSRFVASWNFVESTEDDDVGMIIGVLDYKNEIITRYQTNLRSLKRHYRNLPFESEMDDQFRLFMWTSGVLNRSPLKSLVVSKFE